MNPPQRKTRRFRSTYTHSHTAQHTLRTNDEHTTAPGNPAGINTWAAKTHQYTRPVARVQNRVPSRTRFCKRLRPSRRHPCTRKSHQSQRRQQARILRAKVSILSLRVQKNWVFGPVTIRFIWVSIIKIIFFEVAASSPPHLCIHCSN